MSASAGGIMVPKIPTMGEPWPGLAGEHGLTLLQRLIKRSQPGQKARLEPAEVSALERLSEAMRIALQPAKPAEIAALVEALMWHYPAIQRSEAAAKSVARDWLRDLGHLSAELVDAACSNWRRGPNAYAPMPGHLLAYADPVHVRRALQLETVMRYLNQARGV